MRTVAVALLVVLAACGGGSDPKTSPKPTATKTTTKATTKAPPKPTIDAPTGSPAPEALSQFLCEKNAKGAWNASGTISNAGKNKVTYQVTVQVGEAAGTPEQAMTKQLPNIAGGGSVKFELEKVPAPKTGGTCRVQVLRR